MTHLPAKEETREEKIERLQADAGLRQTGRPTMEELEALTKNVIGDYTEREIEALMKLQERFDAYTYTPFNSQGGKLPDDGSDPFYYYQSNLVPILDLLKGVKDIESEPENSEDEDDDPDGLRHQNQKDNERRKIVASNNSISNEERSRAKLLKIFYGTLEKFGGHADAYVLEALHDNENLFMPDDNSVIEGFGELEDIIQMLQLVAKYRRDQTNNLKKIVEMMTRLLEDCFTQISVKSSAAHQAALEGVSSSEYILGMKKEIESLKREQEYLYFRIYGPKHKIDAKAEKQKKYRREVDETYKHMVDTDVAKKVVKAVKGSDAYVKKLSAEVEIYKAMMKKAHEKMMNILNPGRLAMRCNRQLEQHRLAEEDGHFVTCELQRNLEDIRKQAGNLDLRSAVGMTPTPQSSRHATPPTEGSGGESKHWYQHTKSGPDFRHKLMADGIIDMERELRTSIDSVAKKIGERLCSKKTKDELLKAYCSATSEAANLLKQAFTESLHAAIAVASVLPEGCRCEVGTNFISTFVQRLSDLANTAIPSFVNHMLNEMDTEYIGLNVNRYLKTSGLEPLSTMTVSTDCQTDPVEFAREPDSEEDADIEYSDSHSCVSTDRRRGGANEGMDSESHLSHRSGSVTSEGLISPEKRKHSSKLPKKGSMTPLAKRARQLSVSFSQPSPTNSPYEEGLKKAPSVRNQKVSLEKADGQDKKDILGPKSDGMGSEQASMDSEGRPLTKSGSTRRAVSTPSSETGHRKTSGEDNRLDQTGTTEEGVESELSEEEPEWESEKGEGTGTLVAPTKHHRTNSISGGSATGKTQQTTGKTSASGSSQNMTRNRSQTMMQRQPSLADDGTSPLVLSGSKQSFYKSVMLTKGTNTAPLFPPRNAGIQVDLTKGRKPSTAPDNGSKATSSIPLTAEQTLLPFEEPTNGEYVLVFCSIDQVLAFWDKCPDQMPTVLEMYIQTLRDGLKLFHGVEARTEGDAFFALFADIKDAIAWALSAQHHVLNLPYPKELLALREGVEMFGADEVCLWRGFRIRMGLHIGFPNISTDIKGKAKYSGMDVTFAARVAMTSAGGQIMISNAAFKSLSPRIEELQGVSARPQGECRGQEGMEPIYDIVDPVLTMRHYSRDGKDSVTAGGIMYQWLCTYSAEHDFVVHNSVAFVFVDIQSEIDFLNYDANLINTATSMIVEECKKLTKKYGGSEVRARGPSMMLVFPSAMQAAQFATALHICSLHLNYPPELLAFPECAEKYVDAVLCWRGLQVRIGCHFGKPSSTMHNRESNLVEYYGPEVTRSAQMAALARFGETVMSEVVYDELFHLSDQLGDPRWECLGERLIGGNEKINIFGFFPKSLGGRVNSLGKLQSFFRPVVDARTLSEKPVEEAQEEFEIRDTTYLLSACVENAVELIESHPEELQTTMAQIAQLMKSILPVHDGFQESLQGVTMLCFFYTPLDAMRCALDLQSKLLKINFPKEIHASSCCADIKRDDGQILFRGPRMMVAIHSGRIHEYQTGGMVKRKSYYGTALNQVNYLSTSFSCGGEIVVTENVLDALTGDEEGESFLSAGEVTKYRVDSILLPGDYEKRTPLHGIILDGLAGRRKQFYRGGTKKSGASKNVLSRRFESMRKAVGGATSNIKFQWDGDEEDELTKLDPLRLTAQSLQQLYRLIWHTAKKCGRVMGYPSDVDEDPYAFDAPLREAIVAEYANADETIFNAEATVIDRLKEMVTEMGIALNTKTEKGVYFHRSQQSVILIPPGEKKEDDLYKKQDLGPGRRVQLSHVAGNYTASTKSGEVKKPKSDFRAGQSNVSVVQQMTERRIINLEKEVQNLREKQLVMSSPDGSPVEWGQEGSSMALTVSEENINKNKELQVVSKISQGTQFESQQYVYQMPPPRPHSQPCGGGTGVLWKKGTPLSPLQTPYIPDPHQNSMLLTGEPTNENAMLPPFCRSSKSKMALVQQARLGTANAGRPPIFNNSDASLLRPHSSALATGNQAPGTLPYYMKNSKIVHGGHNVIRRQLDQQLGMWTTLPDVEANGGQIHEDEFPQGPPMEQGADDADHQQQNIETQSVENGGATNKARKATGPTAKQQGRGQSSSRASTQSRTSLKKKASETGSQKRPPSVDLVD